MKSARFSEKKFIQLYDQGIILSNTYVWKNCFDDWKLASETDLFPSVSPPPVPKPPATPTNSFFHSTPTTPTTKI